MDENVFRRGYSHCLPFSSSSSMLKTTLCNKQTQVYSAVDHTHRHTRTERGRERERVADIELELENGKL